MSGKNDELYKKSSGSCKLDLTICDSEKIKGAIFLAGITGFFFLCGFSSTLSTLKKQNAILFHKGRLKIKNNEDSGTELATRALKWGTFYSTVSCGLLVFGVWKITGATSFEDFRQKMGKLLPQISKTSSCEDS